MNKSFKINIPISKIDEEQRTVTGIATTESFDSQGDIVDYAASKKAFGDWLGNIREMHSPIAVGKAIDIQYDDNAKTVQVTARLSESLDGENAWVKVKEGVLAGFSIGGRVLEVVKETIKSGNIEQTANRIKDYVLSELSLVDNPANPDAMFSMVKSVDGQLLRVEQEIDKNTNKPDDWWIEKFMSKKEIKKSVYDAATAVGILTDLAYLIMSESWEDEQDAEQLSSLQAAFKAIQDFTAKEVVEDDTYLGEFNEVIEAGRKAVDLRKESIMTKDIKKTNVSGGEERGVDAEIITTAEEAGRPLNDTAERAAENDLPQAGAVILDEEGKPVLDEEGKETIQPVVTAIVEEEKPTEIIPAETAAEEGKKATTIVDLAKSIETLLSKFDKSNEGDAFAKMSDTLTKFSDKVEKSLTDLEGRVKAIEEQPMPARAKSSYTVIGKGDSEVVDEKAELEKRQEAFIANPMSAPAGEAEAIAKGFRELNRKEN